MTAHSRDEEGSRGSTIKERAGRDASTRTSRSATSTRIRSAARCSPPTTSGSRCSRRTRTRFTSTRAYAAKTEFGQPLVDSTFTLALVTGQSVTDISQNAMANLGWDEVRLPNPVFEGDTIYSRSEVLEKRESKSRPNVGIVTFKTIGVQSGRHGGDRIQADRHGLQARPRAVHRETQCLTTSTRSTRCATRTTTGSRPRTFSSATRTTSCSRSRTSCGSSAARTARSSSTPGSTRRWRRSVAGRSSSRLPTA